MRPAAAVVVATIRALKSHGGVGLEEIDKENLDAVEVGFTNLERHVENVRNFGVPVVVGLNRFAADTDAEIEKLRALCDGVGVRFEESSHFANGSEGAERLARAVESLAAGDAEIQYTYDLSQPIAEKIEAVATHIYRADGIELSSRASSQIAELEAAGKTNLPVCVAKTQYSFSTDAKKLGAPSGFKIPVREVRLSAGAGFAVAVCGDMMTMPASREFRLPTAYP